EPGRLLRDGIRSAPWSSVVGAIGAGALLALTRRWRKPGAAATLTGAPRRSEPTDANPRGGLAALAIAPGLELARRRGREPVARGRRPGPGGKRGLGGARGGGRGAAAPSAPRRYRQVLPGRAAEVLAEHHDLADVVGVVVERGQQRFQHALLLAAYRHA